MAYLPDSNTEDININIGAKADAVATTDTGAFSLIALFKRLLEKFTTLNAKDFSTSAKQDLLLAELQLKADLNETQPTSDLSVITLLSLQPFQIQKGLVSGVSFVNKSGRNSNITSGSVPEDMWNASTIYTGFPTGSPETLQFFSSNVGDTGTLTYTYLATSSSTAWQTATVTLNGTTPVSGVSAYRVHTANYNSGSPTTFNIGTITCRHSVTTANVFFNMPIGTSQTYSAVYTIPSGSTGFVKKIFCDVNTTTSVAIQGALWIRRFGMSPRLQRNFNISNAIDHHEEDLYLKLPALTDITMRITNTLNGS